MSGIFLRIKPESLMGQSSTWFNRWSRLLIMVMEASAATPERDSFTPFTDFPLEVGAGARVAEGGVDKA